ncbi:MAG: ribonuclease P protein component [Methylococcales bacterium]
MQAFRKTDKLNNGPEYARVFSGANRSTDKLFTVLARKNTILRARLGLAIAKKSVKKAVDRNRIKRIIRESFRQQKDSLNNYDFVVLCRDKAGIANKDELAVSIQAHWKKLTKDE